MTLDVPNKVQELHIQNHGNDEIWLSWQPSDPASNISYYVVTVIKQGESLRLHFLR